MTLHLEPKWRYRFLIGTLILLVLFFLYWIRSILEPFLLAAVLAYFLSPLVEYFQKRGFSRTGGIVLTYFILVAIALLVSVYVFPILWGQLQVLLISIPEYTSQAQELLQGFYNKYQRIDIPYSLRQEIDHAIKQVEVALTNSVGQVIDGILGVFAHLFNILMVPVLAFFMLNDEGRTVKKFLAMIPEPWRVKILQLWAELDAQLIKYLKGYLILSFTVGALTSIGFFLIGLEFPFLLGLIVGIFDIIPYFGPVIGAIPAIAVGILESKSKAVSALIVILVIQQLESNILSPKIIGSSVGLHPLLVIFFLLLGNKVYGVIGMLLAVPMAITLRVLWRHVILRWLLEPTPN